jgi:hypothetical protein
MMRGTRWGVRLLCAWIAVCLAGQTTSLAGGPFKRRGQLTPTTAVVPAPAVVAAPTACANDTAPTPMLGTFYPTPYVSIRGNAPTGGGYSPLGAVGDQNLAFYGPLSPLRVTSAPVLTYVRGYDGRTVPTVGTSFSYPNLPAASPVIYPTQATNYFGFRESKTPPWWTNAINWIDQN